MLPGTVKAYHLFYHLVTLSSSPCLSPYHLPYPLPSSYHLVTLSLLSSLSPLSILYNLFIVNTRSTREASNPCAPWHGEGLSPVLSPCHLVTLSPLSPCRLTPLSPCHLVTSASHSKVSTRGKQSMCSLAR